MRTPRALLVLISVLALLLAACPAEDDAPEIDADAPTEEEEESEPEGDEQDEAAGAEDGDVDVALGETDLGEVLVDGEGNTLYMFDVDEPGESACYDDCATAWPPLESADPVAGDGVDQGLLGTTEREDGGTQVTYAEMPLYHWAGDQEPGETNGQGVNDVWWVVDADGEPVRDGGMEDDGEDDDAGGAY